MGIVIIIPISPFLASSLSSPKYECFLRLVFLLFIFLTFLPFLLEILFMFYVQLSSVWRLLLNIYPHSSPVSKPHFCITNYLLGISN